MPVGCVKKTSNRRNLCISPIAVRHEIDYPDEGFIENDCLRSVDDLQAEGPVFLYAAIGKSNDSLVDGFEAIKEHGADELLGVVFGVEGQPVHIQAAVRFT